MQSLQKILGKLVKDHGMEGAVVLKAIKKKWPEVVGQPIASHTFPDTVSRKILTIIVDTPQWMHHLSFYKKIITDKLAHYNINELRFRIGRIPEAEAAENKFENIQLTEEDARYIENTISVLKDEELKEKFRTLIRRGLSRRKLNGKD